ncbi:unnamed protein product [Sympodiomycopsis kandeliae]
MGGISKIVGTIRRKAPTNPNDEARTLKDKSKEEKETSLLHDLTHLKGKDARTLLHALKTLSSGEPLDDRELLLEQGVEMLQTLPSNSGLSHTVSDGFIGMLWKELPHPPYSSVEPQSRFRAADGKGNNPWNPELGRSGTPYSRSVPTTTPKSPFLPEPELVFDQLLKRTGFTEHKSGLNRLFFSFATVVIHEIFQTDRARPWINNASSYVDLCTLYGNNQEEQNRVRTNVQGRIHPDTIASERIMMMPPGVIAVVLLFSRHHNYLAERLFTINESQKYKPWDQLDEAGQKRQDEEIFQFARNINIAFFAKVVLTDYVSAILNTPRQDSDWHLELGKEIKEMGSRLERGTGNQCSAEFNVLYQWHAALSAADEKWMEDLIHATYPGKEIDDIGPMEFMGMAKQHKAMLDSQTPDQWTFGGLQRKSDGHFEDEALAKLLKDCIEEPAHAFGARSQPAAMKVVAILGQLQARNTFQVCTMNEFRKYLNLKPFASFQEWNSDPSVAEAAEKLYGHIDQLELYSGLHAEEAKPNVGGSGVQPGHTVGRGILLDAVALVRGDRFLTVDLTSTTLTNWGLSQLAPVPGAYGGFLSHLLSRGLPRSWGRYSTYNLLPFYTPRAAAGIVKSNGKAELYETSRPADVSKLHGIHSHAACKKIFEDRDTFRNIYHYNLEVLTDRAGFMIGYDDHHNHDPRSAYMSKAFFEPGFEQNVRRWYSQTTKDHIEKHSIGFANPKNPRQQINIARDVFNRVPILWLADRLALPLKTPATPHGLFTVTELFGMTLALFIYSSFDVIPHASWTLRQAALELGPILRKIIKTRLEINSGVKEKIHDFMAKGSAFEVSEAADHLYHTIIKEKIPLDKAVGDVLGSALPVGGNLTQQSTLLVDLFLTPGYEYAKERFTELALRDDDDKAAQKEMEMWVWEGMRISGTVPGLPRVASQDVTLDDGEHGQVHIKEGDRLIIATSKAQLDPAVFPDPTRLDPTRDPKSYIALGHGMHLCFGARLVAPAIVSMLKQVFRLKNVRRAAGAKGRLVKVTEHLGHDEEDSACDIVMYLDGSCHESPVPTSLVLEYDG